MNITVNEDVKCPQCGKGGDRAYHRICHRVYMGNYKRGRNLRN